MEITATQENRSISLIKCDGIIKISTSKNGRYNWQNVSLLWSRFVFKLSATLRTGETIEEYFSKNKEEQGEIKNKGGFVGGFLKDNRHRATSIEKRSVLTLDADYATTGLWDFFTILYDCGAVIYSTHKHTATAPRYRLIILLSREVTTDEFRAISRRIAESLGIDQFDESTSYKPSQIMYWPTTATNGEYYFNYQDGPGLDADKILGSYHNYQDRNKWPLASRETRDNVRLSNSNKKPDPTTKTGPVGAWCNAYDIYEALEKILSNVYESTANPNVYTYINGSTANGFKVFDNGNHGQSFHNSDPVYGFNCNSFDLVRIQKFGLMDEGVDKDVPVHMRPSYAAMVEFVKADPEAGEILEAENSAEILEDFKYVLSDAEEPEDRVEDIFKEKFRQSQLDQNKDYPLPVPVINLHQFGEVIAFLTLKSFSLWQGKQKSKKTTLLVLAVAAFISGATDALTSVYFSAEMDGEVLWFDTEQGENYGARTLRLILNVAGLESSDRLIYCDLRELSPKERKKVIEAGIKSTPNVRLVVIDGMVDLMNDFMDPKEGHLTVTDILKYCSLYNIHVAGVLHQNKGDKNARAHIGTISSQKCEIEISTEVDTNDRSQSIVSCLNSRGLPFEPFAIKWDKGTLPGIATNWAEIDNQAIKATKLLERNIGIAEVVFVSNKALGRAEALRAIEAYSGLSDSTAKRVFDDLKKRGIIIKGDNEKYTLCKEGSLGHQGSL